MIETTELNILLPVWMTLTFMVTAVWEINNFGVQFLTNLDINLDEIQYVATACWFVEAHAKFILHKYYSRERTLLTWFYERYVSHGHVSGQLWTDLFQTWCDAKHN